MKLTSQIPHPVERERLVTSLDHHSPSEDGAEVSQTTPSWQPYTDCTGGSDKDPILAQRGLPTSEQGTFLSTENVLPKEGFLPGTHPFSCQGTDGGEPSLSPSKEEESLSLQENILSQQEKGGIMDTLQDEHFSLPVNRDKPPASAKLTIELVPTRCLMQNVHYRISSASWKRLCLKVFHYQASYRCAICGKPSKTLHCHEQWEYHDLARTRKLTGFLALCPLCYYGKHFEEARLLAKRGELDMQHVEEHFCRVNACTHQEMEMWEREAWYVRKRRNRQKTWKSDYGEYAYLLTPASEPENTPVMRTRRRKPLAYAAGAEKRKDALREKSSSSLHKQDKRPRQNKSSNEQPAEQGSWQQEASFATAFQKSVQK